MSDIPNREELERQLARKISPLFKRQYMAMLEYLGDPPDINNVPESFWDEAGQEFLEAIRPFSLRLATDQAQRLMADLSIGVDWTLVNENAAEWASRYTFDLVKRINQTSRSVLQRAIPRYFRDGWTRQELENYLASSFGPVRAEMIAVTEVTRAAVEGERAMIAELGADDMIEVWQTNNDELVCVICGPRNGKAEGDKWTKEDGPPAHPRCRCWVTHELRANNASTD